MFGAIPALILVLALEGGGGGLIERQQLGVVVWALLLGGLAFGGWPRARLGRTATAAAVAGGALVATQALGLLWTESTERTLGELGRLVLYGGLATLALTTISARNWRAAAGALFAGGFGVCLLAFASRLAPDLIDWGQRTSIGEERLNYPFEYWNALAFVAAATLLLGFAHGCFARGHLTRVLGLATLPVTSMVLYLTYSRGGVLAAAFGGLVFVAVSPDRRAVAKPAGVAALAVTAGILTVRAEPEIARATGSGGAALVAGVALLAACALGYLAPRRLGRGARGGLSGRTRWIVLGAIGLAAALAVVLLGGDGPASRPAAPEIAGQSRPDPASRLLSAESPRWELWASALEQLGTAPLTGHGPGTFSYGWDRQGRGQELVVDSHSVYLDALAEVGLPGGIAIIALIFVLMRGCLRVQAGLERTSDRGLLAGLIAVLAAFALHSGIDWLWEIPGATVVGLGAAAVGLAAGSRPRPRSRPRTRVLAIATAVTLAAVGTEIPGLVAADRVERSRVAVRSGQDDLGIQLADEAVDAAPWFATPLAQRAEAKLAARDLDGARADAAGARAKEPYEWRHLMLIARIDLADDQPDRALRALDQLKVLRPVAADLITRLQSAIEGGDENVLDPYAPSP